jgi:hypothetical protein
VAEIKLEQKRNDCDFIENFEKLYILLFPAAMHTLYFQGVALSSQYGIESMHSFHPEALVLNAPVLFLQTSYNEFINLKIFNHVYVKLSPIYISCF